MTSVANAAGDSRFSGFWRRPATVTESRIFAIIAATLAALALARTLHVARDQSQDSKIIVSTVVVASVVSLTIALAMAAIEGRRGLRRAARLSAFRDSLWRLTGMIAAAIAALAAADGIEHAIFEAAFNRRLEGLALPAGILAGALLIITLAAAAWLLPAIAERRMSVGRTLPAAVADALWFATLVSAIGIGHDLRAAAASGAFSDTVGWGCWVALAAGFTFAAVRIGAPSAVDAEVQSLWILVLGDRTSSRSMQRHAALLAARWRNGPVTIVAAPDLAPVCAGPHLRLAQTQGRLGALFPQRAIQLADWLDTLPPRERWQALPVRELYVDSGLWPQVIEGQFDAVALAVVISEREPDAGAIDRLRTMLPTSRTDFHLAVRNSANLPVRWPGVEIYPIVGQGGEEINRWIAGNAKPREAPTAGGRFVLIVHANADRDFASGLSSRLQGRTDDRNRIVRVETIAFSGGRFSAVWHWARIGYWRQRVFARELRKAGGGRWYELLLALFVNILTLRISAEIELLLIESDVFAIEDLERIIGRSLLRSPSRITAVVRADRLPLLFSPLSYVRVIVRPTADRDAQIAEIARRYLAFDFDSVVPATEPQAVPPEQTARQLRLYLSYPKAYAAVAAELRSRLQRSSDVATGQSSFETSTIEQLRTSVDVLVAVIGPETIRSNWALMELEKAAAAEKPILPVVIERAELPAFIVAVPSNMDTAGALLDLTAPDEEQRMDAFDRTVANIEKALERFRASDRRDESSTDPAARAESRST